MKSGALSIGFGLLALVGSALLALQDVGSRSELVPLAVDDNGQTVLEFVYSTYATMVENRYPEVRDRFNPPYLQFIERDSGSLESFFESRIDTWRMDLLDVEPMEKQFRPDMYRIRAFQDDAQGRPGMVNDVMKINGRWTYVLWSNFKK